MDRFRALLIGYAIALRRFGNRFQEAHLSSKPQRSTERRSAGIYPVWKNDTFVVETVDVRYGEAAASLRGATIERF